MTRAVILVILTLTLTGCTHQPTPILTPTTNTTMQLTSPDFSNGSAIPAQFTCDGGDQVPTLAIADVPAVAQSLALIVDDPDAPGGDFVHWLVWNIPPTATQLATPIPSGAVEGTTGFGSTGYGGPCPPAGRHRYFFTLYALDATLDLPAGSRKAELEQALSGHVLARAQLLGTYQRRV